MGFIVIQKLARILAFQLKFLKLIFVDYAEETRTLFTGI